MTTSTTRVLAPLLAVFLLVGISRVASAQTWTNQIAITGGAQSPTASFSEGYKPGVGFKGTYYYRASRHFFIGVSGGYHWFQAEERDAVLDVVPVQVAFKLNFRLTGIQPYLGGGAGPVLLHENTSQEDRTEVGMSPKFGFRIPIAHGVDLDLNVTYEVVFTDPETTTYLGANAGVAYIFGR